MIFKCIFKYFNNKSNASVDFAFGNICECLRFSLYMFATKLKSFKYLIRIEKFACFFDCFYLCPKLV